MLIFKYRTTTKSRYKTTKNAILAILHVDQDQFTTDSSSWSCCFIQSIWPLLYEFQQKLYNSLIWTPVFQWPVKRVEKFGIPNMTVSYCPVTSYSVLGTRDSAKSQMRPLSGQNHGGFHLIWPKKNVSLSSSVNLFIPNSSRSLSRLPKYNKEKTWKIRINKYFPMSNATQAPK